MPVLSKHIVSIFPASSAFIGLEPIISSFFNFIKEIVYAKEKNIGNAGGTIQVITSKYLL